MVLAHCSQRMLLQVTPLPAAHVMALSQVDALHAALSSGTLTTSASTSSSSSLAPRASRAQLTLLSCLKHVWACHGKHCLSRLHETLASTRSHWRPSYPADLRVAAAQCCLAAIATPGSLRGMPIAQHLALVKPLFNDQVTILSMQLVKGSEPRVWRSVPLFDDQVIVLFTKLFLFCSRCVSLYPGL